MAYKIAGLVLIGQLRSPRTIKMISESETSTVEVHEIDSTPIDIAVSMSNFAATRGIVGRLIKLWQCKIAFISAFPDGSNRMQCRLEEYHSALDAAGLIAHADFKIEIGARVFKEMFKQYPDIDTVVSNDIIGLGVQLQ